MNKNRTLSLPCILICLFLVLCVRGDIADCIQDKHCDEHLNECCARVIVEDSRGNFIDSHYCLQRDIIKELGNRYYFKGILGRAYCNYSTILSAGTICLLSMAVAHFL